MCMLWNNLFKGTRYDLFIILLWFTLEFNAVEALCCRDLLSLSSIGMLRSQRISVAFSNASVIVVGWRPKLYVTDYTIYIN
jgi:hypothetical protein